MKIGDSIEFGRYTIEAPVPASPGEQAPVSPISWRVLDTTDEAVLVISEYGLDAKPYQDTSVTFPNWKDCSLRKWMNGQFMTLAFNEEERERIRLTDIDNSLPQHQVVHPMTGLKPTKDHVFLLSVKEAEVYFPTVESARAMPTEFVKYLHEQGGTAAPLEEENGRCMWLLRSPGPHIYSVRCISGYGSLDITSANRARSIRPAMWISK